MSVPVGKLLMKSKSELKVKLNILFPSGFYTLPAFTQSMEKGVSSSVAFTMIIFIVVVASTSLFFWIQSSSVPSLNEKFNDMDAHVINSSALSVINMGTENSSSLTALSTSIGNCSFSSATVLQPGVKEACTFSSPIPNGTLITIYGGGFKQVLVQF